MGFRLTKRACIALVAALLAVVGCGDSGAPKGNDSVKSMFDGQKQGDGSPPAPGRKQSTFEMK